MTLAEFKAWFEGFTESIDTAPTEVQFARIKARVAEIDSKPITREVFVERYRDIWPRYFDRPYYASYGTASPVPMHGVVTCQNSNSLMVGATAGSAEVWDGAIAMAQLGRAEAKQ